MLDDLQYFLSGYLNCSLGGSSNTNGFLKVKTEIGKAFLKMIFGIRKFFGVKLLLIQFKFRSKKASKIGKILGEGHLFEKSLKVS
jgi:hypothetical protein